MMKIAPTIVTITSANCDVLLHRTVPVGTPEEAVDIILKLQGQLRLHTHGIGLSANQIGIPKSVAIIRYGNVSINLINPEIVAGENVFINPGEGCLSLPGRQFNVERFRMVKIRNNILWPSSTGTVAIGEDMNRIPLLSNMSFAGYTLNTVDQVYVVDNHPDDCGGIVAVGIQHEIGHLNGELIDRLPSSREVFSKDNPKWNIGRNEPCPCGSGLKFKKCCLPKVEH